MSQENDNESKKWIYTFNVDKDVIKKVSEEKKEADGSTITISRDVKEKQSFLFKIKKPNRKIIEDADIYYAAKMGEYLKAGLLSKNLILKRLENDGGDLGEASKKEYGEAMDSFYKLSLEVGNLEEELKKNETEELKGQLIERKQELADIKKLLFEFELTRSSIFDQSAESKALVKQIFWFILNLLHWDKGSQKDEFESYFKGKNFDEKLEDYDKKEEGAEDLQFFNTINNISSFAVSYWVNSGGKTSQEEIDKARKTTDD